MFSVIEYDVLGHVLLFLLALLVHFTHDALYVLNKHLLQLSHGPSLRIHQSPFQSPIINEWTVHFLMSLQFATHPRLSVYDLPTIRLYELRGKRHLVNVFPRLNVGLLWTMRLSKIFLVSLFYGLAVLYVQCCVSDPLEKLILIII